jgi:Uncharacterized protein conserved in bacteria
MPAKAPKAENFDVRVDAYINKANPFAQPILTYLRELIHRAIPDATETIKWSHVFFEYKGRIVANMAGFKQHCSIGFWGKEMTAVLKEADLLQDGAMGSLGKIASLKDLPSKQQLVSLFKQAAVFIDDGQYTSAMAGRSKNTMARAAKPALKTPPHLASALKANKAAAKVFANFSPSCQREYIEWITEAKRPETRERRLAQAIEMISEGKQRNWKYQTR